jgi:V/A-type H+/Na+-transporting ATPase subunit G/H
LKFKASKKTDSKKSPASKEIPATTAAPGKIDTIIKALSGLESNIDSLNEKLADMKKELNQKAQKEIDKLQEEVTQMATKEAEVIITESREKANSESQRIMTAGDLNLKDVQNKIDAKFNEAVELVVSTVLKA